MLPKKLYRINVKSLIFRGSLNKRFMITETEVAETSARPSVIRLRLSPRVNSELGINNTSNNVIINDNVSSGPSNDINSLGVHLQNPLNRSYLSDQYINPWPAAIPRPSLEEIRNARIAAYSPNNGITQDAADPIPVSNAISQNSLVPTTVEPSTFTPLSDILLPNNFFTGPIIDFISDDLSLNPAVESAFMDQINEISMDQQNAAILNNSMSITENTTLVSSSHINQVQSSRVQFSRLIGTQGLVNSDVSQANLIRFQYWGPSSINVPRHLSRHELVLSFFLSLLSNEAINHFGVIVTGGSFSSLFLLAIFRRIFLSILNPTFWTRVHYGELESVLSRALSNARRVPFYVSPPRFEDLNNILVQTRQSLRGHFNSALRDFRRGNYWALFISTASFSAAIIALIVRAGGFASLPGLPQIIPNINTLTEWWHFLGDRFFVPTPIPNTSIDYVETARRMLEMLHEFFLN